MFLISCFLLNIMCVKSINRKYLFRGLPIGRIALVQRNKRGNSAKISETLLFPPQNMGFSAI